MSAGKGARHEGSEQRQARLDREEFRGRLDQAEKLLRSARDFPSSERIVDVDRGIRLDVSGLSAHDLLRPETEVKIIIDWPIRRRFRCPIGTLQRAAREWTGEPESMLGQIYGSIAAALP